MKRSDIYLSQLGTRYQMGLIFIIVLCLYYPAIFSEISVLDDRDAIASLSGLRSYDIASLFISDAKDGGYYRPFLGISYLIDRFWWDLNPVIMHFENVLLHLVNSLLVFFLGKKLSRNEASHSSLLPLAGATLFAVHPIMTESVNWISGRTDPLACIFVLLALWFVLLYKENSNLSYLLAAFICTLFGIFSKETALGFYLGFIFILTAERDDAHIVVAEEANITLKILIAYTGLAVLIALLLRNFYAVLILGIVLWLNLFIYDWRNNIKLNIIVNIKKIFYNLLSLLIVISLFVGLRNLAFSSSTSKIKTTLKALSADLNYTLEMFFGAAGFYVKKFILPLPLSLAIREIDPLYSLLGVVCFVLGIYIVYLNKCYTALIITGFMLLSPAFMLVMGTFAWTSYAERYCYIPSAFWILAGVSYISDNSTQFKIKKHLILIFILVLILFTLSSFHRNLVWQKNITIMKDTVEKTPNFKNARGLYISALVENSDFEEAARQYLEAKKIKVIAYDVRYDILYANILSNMKKYSEVEQVYRDSEAEARAKGGITELYEAMIYYYDSRMIELSGKPDAIYFKRKKTETLKKLYAINKSPQIGYRLSQNYLDEGRHLEACKVLKSVIADHNTDELVKQKAVSLLKRIE